MEQACSELGLSMSAAFTIFAKKVGREKRIPFDVSVDPFYSETNCLSSLLSNTQYNPLGDGRTAYVQQSPFTINTLFVFSFSPKCP